ncbi:ankyrin repeat domain-containing protein [Wolbachia endosymbiont of Tribolium confusum]|uniref:ankyrin repeat domain-containing protein n=1 Tax=Wolbachia endosymbiont of Tribolium confusum TaxID=214474 RepID=UPI001CF468EA|nr:ankyrin repeat domain-containing protein [Wolbachia endosymbiont of Tribolium confusum]MCA7010565.1 ankyrin repeat domain-containing protein [Wolbachia endosymbiont of Tribolium confusum]
MKGEINAAANFQAEDFESKNATDLDYLANPLSASNAKLENSVKAKDKKNEAPFSSRRGSSHVLEFFSNENVEIHIQDKTPCAAQSESGIAGLFKGRNSMNVTLYQSKVQRSSAIDYSTTESIGSRLLNIFEGEEDISFDQEINFLYKEGCLYDALLLQDEKNQDTPLHVAIKKNHADFVKKLLCILKEPYRANEFYKHKYFEHKQENEKPLFKVINTKNKDGKDVITLTIEGNNSECISALFNYLTDKNINRRKDVESEYTPLHEAVLLNKNEAIKELLKSKDIDTELIDKESYKAYNYTNNQEAIELFIKHYSSKISELRIKSEDNNKKLARIKCVLNKTKLTCVCLAAFGSCFRMYRNSHDIINEEVSEDMLYYSLALLSNTTGLILFFNYLIDTILSKYEEKNSSLNKESDNYVEERNMLKNKLRHFQKRGTGVTTQMYEIISVTPESDLSYSRL